MTIRRGDVPAAFQAGLVSGIGDTCPHPGGILAAAWRDGRRQGLEAARAQMIARLRDATTTDLAEETDESLYAPNQRSQP